MRFTRQFLAAALTLLAWDTPARGADLMSETDSQKFFVSQPPPAAAGSPERERLQAFDGSLYAVVAPVYAAEPFFSFLRLFNGGASAATFTVMVVGTGAGGAYGPATYEIPSMATRQLSVSEILVAANAVTRQAGDSNFVFYVKSPEPLAGYQHVTLHFAARYFENASVCKDTLQNVMRRSVGKMILPSVHTTQLSAAGYPASVEVHNYASSHKMLMFEVRDEATGAVVGTMPFSTLANGSYTIPFSQIESTARWTPTADQLRANLVVTDQSGAAPTVLLSQSIQNTTLGVALNMTTMCAVNAPDESPGPGGSGTQFRLTVAKGGTGTGVVTSSPAGVVCNTDCTSAGADYAAGTTVQLLPSPANGASFQGWSGACTGTGSCSVLMNAAQTVTASFGPILNSLSVTVTGRGQVISSPNGIVCGILGTECTFGFATGTTVSLSAGAAGTNVNFIGWSGPCASISTNPGDSICNVTIGGAQSVTANFRP